LHTLIAIHSWNAGDSEIMRIDASMTKIHLELSDVTSNVCSDRIIIRVAS